jgi:hypothetical protein
MPWYTQHPEPSNVGEPQSVRDANDAMLARQGLMAGAAEKEADAQIDAAFSEIGL